MKFKNNILFIVFASVAALLAFLVINHQQQTIAKLKVQNQYLLKVNNFDSLVLSGELSVLSELPDDVPGQRYQIYLTKVNNSKAKQNSILKHHKLIQQEKIKLSANIQTLVNKYNQVRQDFTLTDSFNTELLQEISYLEQTNTILLVGINQTKNLVDSLIALRNELEFTNEAGVKILYRGAVKNGEANGYGTAYFSTGSFYIGQWQNNKRHGSGKYIWANGDSYTGNFEHNKRNGYGTYNFSSGEKYEGNWKNDLRNGYGKLIGADGKVVLEGKWNGDKMVAQIDGTNKPTVE